MFSVGGSNPGLLTFSGDGGVKISRPGFEPPTIHIFGTQHPPPPPHLRYPSQKGKHVRTPGGTHILVQPFWHCPPPLLLLRLIFRCTRDPPLHFLCSWEMYDDYHNNKPEVSSSFQWYREFNALCRAYGKTEPIDSELEAKWQLFLPFATLLDQAIRALPPTSMVLYRGMSRKAGFFTETWHVKSR